MEHQQQQLFQQQPSATVSTTTTITATTTTSPPSTPVNTMIVAPVEAARAISTVATAKTITMSSVEGLSPISHAMSYIKHEEQELQKDDDENKKNSHSNNNNSNSVDVDADCITITNDSQSLSQSISQSFSKLLSFSLSPSNQSISQQLMSSSLADNNNNHNNDNSSDVAFDLNDLFLLLQRKEWDLVFDFLEENPNVSKQIVHSKAGTSPLLHEVLRHGPPLSIVNLLLLNDNDNDEEEDDDKGNDNDNFEKSLDVFKQRDAVGVLPLHAACSCGHADINVIIQLILFDADALRIRTLDRHGRFPLHIAVASKASEDVVMELLTNFPEASFIPDFHGKIPLEYAKESCYGHNRLVVALESASILLASSQAGVDRVSKEYEDKLSCLRGAHAEYAEQLEDRFYDEKIVLLKGQLKCNDELAIEKERNIALAQALLEKKDSERNLLRQRDEQLQLKFDGERFFRRNITKARDEELKRILLGIEKERTAVVIVVGQRQNSKNNDNDGDDYQGEEDNDDINNDREDQDELIVNNTRIGDEDDEAQEQDSSKMPLTTLLKRLSKGYENSKLRNRSYKEQLDRQRETVTNLNQLLVGKEEELRLINRKFRVHDFERQAAIDRANNLEKLHETALQNLAEARDQTDHLTRIDSERRGKLAHSERRLRIQEKRFLGVQNLISSWNINRGKVEEEYDNNNQISDIITNHCSLEGDNINITSPSRRQDEVDLSVEIELAAKLAAAAAHLDDAASTTTSISMRRKEADLSTEIRLTAAAMAAPTQPHVEDVGKKKRDTIVEEEFTNPSSNTSNLTPETMNVNETIQPMSRRMNKVRGSQNTCSVFTSTTATTGGDSGFDHYQGDVTSTPETPPIPERVQGCINRGDDGCSPLGLPTLAIQD